MWFFRKNSNPRAKQILFKGQKKKQKAPQKFPLKHFWGALACILCFSGAFYGIYFYGPSIGYSLKTHIIALERKTSSQFLKRIEFYSNGVLTSQWLKSYLPHFGKNAHLMDVDISTIRKKIMTCHQVKSVEVKRLFPDGLGINITERTPLLRLRVQDGKIHREMMVDAEGVIFYGEKFSPMERHMIPFLKGIILKKTPDGNYNKIHNLEKIYPLLHIAKTKYWPIYTQIEVISIEHLSSKKVPWSRIEARCRFATSVIFKDHNFDEQLKRLDFILQVPSIRSQLPLKYIDLTLGKEAVVKFRK